LIQKRQGGDIKKPRVLIVHNKYQLQGGESTVVNNENFLLQKNGHEVQVELVSNHLIDTIKSKVTTGINASYSDFGYRWMIEKIEKFGPDIVHVLNFFPLLSPSIFHACKIKNIPSVFTLHNFRLFCSNGVCFKKNKPCEACLFTSAYGAIFSSCYRESKLATFAVARMIEENRKQWPDLVDHFITLNEFSKEKFQLFGIPHDKMTVKSNFVPNTYFNQIMSFRPKSKNKKTATFLGRLSDEKGIIFLLEMWKKKSPDLMLQVIGDGPLYSKVKTYESSKIKVYGKLDGHIAKDELFNSNFLIVPSLWYEMFPMVIAEGFSLGTPVVATKIGGIPEIVIDEYNGLLFEQGDENSLFDKVDLLSKNFEYNSKLSAGARKTFDEKYNEEINYEKLLTIYTKILSKEENVSKNNSKSNIWNSL